MERHLGTRRTRTVVVFTALAAALAACGSSSTTGGSSSGGGAKHFTVVEVNGGLTYPFGAAIDQGIRDKAKQLGVTIIALDSKSKTDVEASNVQDAITQHPDGILLQPNDGATAAGEVDKIHAAGITVIAVHTQVGKNRAFADVYPGLAAFVTQDEVAAGEQAGAIAVKLFPTGTKVGIVEGSGCCFEAVRQRTEGFLGGTTSVPGFQVVAKQPGAWVADTAQTACQNMLQSNPNIGLFYAQSDDMAAGCAKAIQAAHSSALTIGIGGSKLGIAGIESGAIAGTVCYKPYDMGQMAMQDLYDVLTGAAHYDRTFLPYQTPAITKDNVSQCTPQW